MSMIGLFATAASDVSGIGTVTWSSPTNAEGGGDSVYAAATLASTQVSHYLKLECGGHGVPAGATIDGVVATFRKRADAPGGMTPTITDYEVRLVLAGNVSGSSDNKATGDTWPDPVDVVDYGGPTDTWGLSLTVADVNDTGFGVAISAQASGGMMPTDAEVDCVEVDVYYTEASGDTNQATWYFYPARRPRPPARSRSRIIGGELLDADAAVAASGGEVIVSVRPIGAAPRPHSAVWDLAAWDVASPEAPPLPLGELIITTRHRLAPPRAHSLVLGPLDVHVDPVSGGELIVSARHRPYAPRSRTAIFADPEFTEDWWLPQVVTAARPRGLRPARPHCQIVQADIPSGQGVCECEPGGAVVVGPGYAAVIVSLTDASVGETGAVIVRQGYGRAVIVSQCDC